MKKEANNTITVNRLRFANNIYSSSSDHILAHIYRLELQIKKISEYLEDVQKKTRDELIADFGICD